MKDSKLKQILIILMMLSMGLFIISCGSSGGDDSPQLDLVSGVAATGAPMTGNVTLKDSNNIVIGPQAIGVDGSFSFDVTGLTPPFYIRAVDSITGEVLYSVSMGSGTGNVNPLTNLAVAIAAKVSDPAMVYDYPASYPIKQETLDQAINDILANLEPFFEEYGCKGQNPLTDPFKANQEGLDKFFDDVKIAIGGGVVTFTDKKGNETCKMSVPGMDVTYLPISVKGSGSAVIYDGFLATLFMDINGDVPLSSTVSGTYQTEYFESTSITGVYLVKSEKIKIKGSAICTYVSVEDCTFTVTLTDSNPDVLDLVLLDADGVEIDSYYDIVITEGDFVVSYLSLPQPI